MYLSKFLNYLLVLYISSFKVTLCHKPPSVLLSVNARNEEYTLPTFFGYIDALDYPKDRISILIQTDHNEDDTALIINEWVTNTKNFYHRIIVRHDAHPEHYSDAKGPCEWTLSRYTKILQNRQVALDIAREQWADYLFQVNADNFLLSANTLKDLISEEKVLIAPMLVYFDATSGYSNFWGGMDERGYYKRVPEYFDILKRRTIGTFEVPMIHSTFLLDMRDERVDRIQHYPIPSSYDNDHDHFLIFAWGAREAGIPMYICNKDTWGFMMGPYHDTMTLREKHQLFTDAFIDYVAYFDPLIRSEYVNHEFEEATKKGFDEVYMINLVRRPDRRMKMEVSFKELGFDYKYFPAVDGKNFTSEGLKKMGIKAMSDFKDPFLERPLTFGEIGCFMSHYNIWLEIIERELEMVLVLEDDIRFEPDFNQKLNDVMTEAHKLLRDDVEWDILYLGRKPLILNKPEKLVAGCKKIVWAKYSYWTLGYVLRLSGAKQLVAGDPLGNMIPVDEYIPIKFNEHTSKELLERFSPRDMIGFSATPLILFPTHYIGDTGYISDTEDTLSFEGKDVSEFRRVKLKELEQQKAKEKERMETGGENVDRNEIYEKTKDAHNHFSDVTNARKNQAEHEEL